jgi:hypothetical protein
MKKLTAFLLLSFVFCCCTLSAQNRNIYGYVGDSFTKEGLPHTRVTLMTPDSAVVDTTSSDLEHENQYLQSAFSLKVAQPGTYILRLEREGYFTTYCTVSATFSKRSQTYYLNNWVLMKRDYHYLQGVTVTATKVKMVMRGDTVVYNADAFHLSQGSMLDALVKQLPGVELKDDGRIYKDGKFVESLLINGKDFFKGDPKIALDNLPAYMVKDVRIYDRQETLSSMASVPNRSGHTVMDVNLKKQYSIGWIANAEAGRGTHDRYLGRLFTLRFTKNSRLALFANANNLNDLRKPGRDGDWTPAEMPDGLLATKTAGLSYLLEGVNEKYSLSSETTIEHRDADNNVRTLGETFLSGGNTFARALSSKAGRSTNFKTNNSFYDKLGPSTVSGLWNMNYLHFNNDERSLYGNFSSDPSAVVGTAVLDSLFAGNSSPLFRRIITNRSRTEMRGSGHELTNSLRLGYSLITNSVGDKLDINAGYRSISHKEDLFDHYLLDYPSNAALSADYRNRYYNKPLSQYSFNLDATYIYYIYDNSFNNGGTLLFQPGCHFKQSYRSVANNLYRLDRLNGWGADAVRGLGTLPSLMDSLQMAVDGSNTYHSSLHSTEHKAGVFVYWFNNLNHKGWPDTEIFEFQATLDVVHKRDALHYYRNGNAYPLTHSATFFSPDIRLRYQTSQYRNVWRLSYNATSEMPNPTYMIGIRDDSDPLNISLGNPNLKNSHLHTARLSYEERDGLTASLTYHILENAVSMGFVYDRATGVRTITPDNVNGNWGLEARCQLPKSFGKKKEFTFNSEYTADYENSVDLVSLAGENASRRSPVRNLYMREVMRLDYRPSDKLQFGVKAGGDWTRASSRREDFTTVNAEAFNYGLTGQIQLPWNVQIATDLTMYSRRGYQDSSMNTNELVWNGRISKSVMHGNLTFILDGFDILGNLSNVRRTLNAQGRTETYYNVIPRYAMLHAVYRLNIQPKKKK